MTLQTEIHKICINMYKCFLCSRNNEEIELVISKSGTEEAMNNVLWKFEQEIMKAWTEHW